MHRTNSKDWKWLSLEWNNNSRSYNWCEVEFISRSNPLSLHSTIGCKDCSSPMQRERNIAGGWVCGNSQECVLQIMNASPLHAGSQQKNVIWKYISIHLVRFFSQIYEDVQDHDLDHGLYSFPGSLFLFLWVISFWWNSLGWNKILRLCSLILQWPRQRFWQGCYRTVVDPQTRYS